MVIKVLKPTGRKLLAFKAFPHLREIVPLVSANILSVFTRPIIHSDARAAAFENSRSGLGLEGDNHKGNYIHLDATGGGVVMNISTPTIYSIRRRRDIKTTAGGAIANGS